MIKSIYILVFRKILIQFYNPNFDSAGKVETSLQDALKKVDKT